MRMVTRSIPVALALCVGAAQLSAQQPGNGTFQWYVGGHGGVMNFGMGTERENIALGGAHLLVTARRTGLLLSAEQGFDADGAGIYTVQTFDSEGIHNRMCSPCRGLGDPLGAYGYQGAAAGRRPRRSAGV